MKVYKEITSLREHEPWGGAKYWYEKILEEELGEEFIQFIEVYKALYDMICKEVK